MLGNQHELNRDINGRILIIDDNPNLLKTMKRVLSQKGYEVLTSINELEVIAIAENTLQIDIIFIDIEMPLANAIENCTILNRLNPDAIVILMTDYTVEDLIQQADCAHGIVCSPIEFEKATSLIKIATKAENGAPSINSTYPCLHKPLDMIQLFILVEQILSRKVEVIL